MGKPKLFECSFTFIEDEPRQFIEIAVVDEGGGPFWVIKTERWAVDDLKAFNELFANVVKSTKENME